MKSLLLPLFAALSLPLAAQAPSPQAPAPDGAATTPHAAAKQRLQAVLAKTATQTDTAFEAKWGAKGKNRRNPFGRLLGLDGKGAAKGAWHKQRTHVAFEGEEGDQLLFCNDRLLACDNQRDWCLRSNRFADGNDLLFAPRPQHLLRQLAGMSLAVTHREAGAIDDRPVEIVSVTLTGEQLAELIWSGCLPKSLLTSGSHVFNVAIRAGQKMRQPQPTPDATVDLAIALDPGTRLVHEVRVRAWVEEGNKGGVFVFPAGKVAVGGADDEDTAEEEEQDDEADQQGDAPLTYENGLPKRPRKGMAVADYTIKLHSHGEVLQKTLTDRQHRLLR